MDVYEKEAVLSLVHYFSDYRVVFDVGSNKGEWADILINNVDEMYLFEPNIKLLNYTEIKYAHLRNVTYKNWIVSKDHQRRTFWQFNNEFNGLSSVYINPKWKDYLSEAINQESIPLDSRDVDHIDLLKIDVEGAEWDVIQGAETLLKENKVKFIQIEYSEHYKVPGYKFQEVIDFVGQFGYQLYEYNGAFFKPKFIEDYGHKNYFFMQEFTEDWNQELKKNTKGLKVKLALEVGCFEGLTTSYICDNLLTEGGRVICIDPLDDVYLTENIDKEATKMNKDFTMFKGQFDRFTRNTKDKPVELLRTTSSKVALCDHYKFDLIYIDGDHREKKVYNDGAKFWPYLQMGGLMLFDDYKWRKGTKRGIDKFLGEKKGFYKTKIKGYQLGIVRTNQEPELTLYQKIKLGR